MREHAFLLCPCACQLACCPHGKYVQLQACPFSRLWISPTRHPLPAAHRNPVLSGPGGYYRGLRTKIVQSVLAAALLFVAKVRCSSPAGALALSSAFTALLLIAHTVLFVAKVRCPSPAVALLLPTELALLH